MTTPVRFWVDPACPWCWVTALWIREVAPERDLDITWEPISLLFKNQPDPEGTYYPVVAWSHGLLRVLESVRSAEGDAAVEPLYVEYGRRIHHDDQRHWDAAEALRAVGLDEWHAAAADDDVWDEVIRRRMDEGLALVGTDVGTPIISVRADDGREMGIFGPVITSIPEHGKALALWDATVLLTTMDELFELKRTRTSRPEPGARP